MITVGKITKPQGVRGEVKVMPMTDDPSRFCVLKCVYIDGVPYKVTGARAGAGEAYLKLAGVNDRNAAELLRGKLVTVDREAAVPLGEGEFYTQEIIGSTLVASGAAVGRITAVQSFGAADVFTVDCGGRGMTFAFIKALDPVYDAQKNELTVDGEVLKQVAVYDED